MKPDKAWDRLDAILLHYEAAILDDLHSRFGEWSLDLTDIPLHEVVGALLARQVTLAVHLCRAPAIWNGHLAPVVLRTMVDLHISLAWILDDPDDRSKKFIAYGLGQEKLNLEHRRRQLENDGYDPNADPVILARAAWLDTQRFSFLTEIDLANWSGLTVRQMAKQANCLDLYRYAYQPFSSATHSMWQHVARYNLAPCSSPLHRHHGLPCMPEVSPDTDYVYRAAKYVEKSFRLFERSFGLPHPAESPLVWLESALHDEFGGTSKRDSSEEE